MTGVAATFRCVPGVALVLLAAHLLVPISCFGVSPATPPRLSGLTCVDDAVAVTYNRGSGNGGWVEVHSGKNGRLLWRRHLAGAVLLGAPCQWADSLYVPTFNDGIYVLSSRDGRTRAQLQKGSVNAGPQLACTANRLVASEEGRKWTVRLTAYDTKTLRVVWTQSFSDRYLWRLAGKHDAFVATLSEPFGPGPSHQPARFETVSLAAMDGRVVGRGPIRGRAGSAITSAALPGRLAKWVARVSRQDDTFRPRTRTERRPGIWFVGVLGSGGSPGKLYALRRSGAIVWTRTVSRLSDIVLCHGRLVAAALDQPASVGPSTADRLVALDSRTGRLIWSAGLR